MKQPDRAGVKGPPLTDAGSAGAYGKMPRFFLAVQMRSTATA